MDNNFKNTEDAFKIFGDKVIHRARLYLRKRKNKKGYTTNTKKSTLSNSLNFNVKVYPSGSLEMDFNAVDYMPFVEEGRKPGKMPPPSAIAEWIKIKPLKLRDSNTGRFKAKTKANINSAAFAIAMSIKTYGIEPTFFFRDAFKMHHKRLAPTILQAYGKDSAIMLQRILGSKYTKTKIK